MPAGGPRVNRYERRHHNDRREDNPEFRAHVFPPWGETSWWSFRRSSKESCDPCHILVEYFINFLYDCDERFFCWVHNRRQPRRARLGALVVTGDSLELSISKAQTAALPKRKANMFAIEVRLVRARLQG
jgi:hypothetical protein